jgi:hypothetical protein
MYSTTIPLYVNTQNLTGDDLEIASFDYYCNNLYDGIAQQGLIQMFYSYNLHINTMWDIYDTNYAILNNFLAITDIISEWFT